MVDVRESNIFDILRFIASSLLLCFSLVVTVYAIVFQHTMFWKIVPGWVALFLFILDLILLGIVEGLQIALVELKRQHPESYRKSHPLAYRLGQVAAKCDNVERFLMGRQVFVVVLVFFCAKLTTIHLDAGDKFLFPVPHWFDAIFLQSGILSCLVVVIIAQLMPQIVAAKYPVHFLQIFIMRPAYYICVLVEASGITHICWVLSHLLSLAAGMTSDEEVTSEVTKILNSDSKSVSCDSCDSSYQSAEGTKSSREASDIDVMSKIERDVEQQQFSRFTEMVRKTNALVTPDTMAVMRYHLDQHPEKFSQFPMIIGSKMYPAPQTLADKLTHDGHYVPKFLSNISDPEHIPPHIVAYELLAENRVLKQEVEFLQRKLNTLQN